MKKILILFLVILSFSFILKEAEATIIFQDGFESGFNQWGTTGSPEINTTFVHEGVNSSKFTASSSYVYKTFPDQTTLHVRFYIYFDNTMPTSGNTYHLHLRNGGTSIAYLGMAWSGSLSCNRYFMYTFYPTESSEVSDCLEAGRWYNMELKFVKDTINGGYWAYLDEIEVMNRMGIDTSGAPGVNTINLGIRWSDQAIDTFIDDVVIADEYIGDETTTSTTSTIGTTTTSTTTTSTSTIITTTTSTTTTVPTGQVTISGQLKNATGPIQASVIVYNERTNQENTSGSTVNGNYALNVWPDFYDLKYEIFYIPNLFIKLMSLNVLSSLYDAVNYVNKLSNGISFRVNITTDQEIHVYSDEKPKSVKVNGVEMIEVSSLPVSTNEWFYNANEKKLHLIASPSLPTTTTTIPATTTTSTTTTTIPGTTTTLVPPEIFIVGFENPDDFEVPEDPATGYVWASQNSYWTMRDPEGTGLYFGPATDIVHSDSQSANLSLGNPIDEGKRRVHIYHEWGNLETYKHIWFESWYYFPTDFIMDDWIQFHSALGERYFTRMGPIHWFAFGGSITQYTKVAEGQYKLETVKNHGWIDEDCDGNNDLPPHDYWGDWIRSNDTIKFGEWFKITTYVHRSKDPAYGIYTMWLNDKLQWNLTNLRTMGFDPMLVDQTCLGRGGDGVTLVRDLPRTGGVQRVQFYSGIALYCGDLPCNGSKDIRADDVILSNQPEI